MCSDIWRGIYLSSCENVTPTCSAALTSPQSTSRTLTLTYYLVIQYGLVLSVFACYSFNLIIWVSLLTKINISVENILLWFLFIIIIIFNFINNFGRWVPFLGGLSRCPPKCLCTCLFRGDVDGEACGAYRPPRRGRPAPRRGQLKCLWAPRSSVSGAERRDTRWEPVRGGVTLLRPVLIKLRVLGPPLVLRLVLRHRSDATGQHRVGVDRLPEGAGRAAGPRSGSPSLRYRRSSRGPAPALVAASGPGRAGSLRFGPCVLPHRNRNTATRRSQAPPSSHNYPWSPSVSTEIPSVSTEIPSVSTETPSVSTEIFTCVYESFSYVCVRAFHMCVWEHFSSVCESFSLVCMRAFQ